MPSDIEISNLALIKIGAAEIRSFDERNKRARTCETVYKHVRDALLSQFNWSFARKRVALRQTEEDPRGTAYSYSIPADCVNPIDIEPKGSFEKWEILNGTLWTSVPDPYLVYISKNTATGLYPPLFIEALASLMAVSLTTVMRQTDIDKGQLRDEASLALVQAQDNDAQRGSESIHPDQDPENDPFVNPRGRVGDLDLSIYWRD